MTALTSQGRSVACMSALMVSVAFSAHAEIPAGPVKIGVLTDLSGSTSDAAGAGSAAAARLAVEDVGGMVAGRQIEIVVADHQNKPDIGSSIARRWFDQENVSVIVDLPYTQIALAAIEIGKQKDRAVLVASAASSDLTGKDCSAISTHWTDDTYALASGTARVLTKAGRKTWFFVTADYAFGHALQRDATAAIEAEGGKVVGSARHPLPSPDMASYILQADASKADAVGLANVGVDTINSIKQAAEFGLIDSGKTVAGLLVFINDINAIGLAQTQGLTVTSGFYWDQNDATRKFSERFRKVTGKVPSKAQAAVYAGVKHWLKAVEATNDVSGKVVTQEMRKKPVDYFGSQGSIRPDGRVLYDISVYQVKSPQESKAPFDFYKKIAVIGREEAFRPLSQSECPLAKEPAQ